MRKFLTALMAVMLLLSTFVIFASAAEPAITGPFDNSVSADSDSMDLVITEVMADSKNDYPGNEDLDAYDYIEIYNRGTSPVDLATLSLVHGRYDTNAATSSPWLQSGYTFTGKLNLTPNSAYSDAALGINFSPKHAVMNPADLTLQPGKFAIVWIWTNQTYSVSELVGESLGKTTTVTVPGEGGAPATQKTVFHKAFRDFYSKEESGVIDAISDDTLVIAAIGANTIDSQSVNKSGFVLNNDMNGGMYALVDKTWDLGGSGAGSGDKTLVSDKLNEKIHCLFHFSKSHKGGVPYVSMGGRSAIYVPANQVPYLDNETAKAEAAAGATATELTDFVERDTKQGYVASYKECALMTYWEYPTPGSMMPYQWVYVDEANTPDSAKQFVYDGNEYGDLARPVVPEGQPIPVNANWKTDAFNALKKAKILEGDDVTSEEIEREEVEYLTQEEIANKNNNATNINLGTKKVLAKWALVLIIVGGVLVVAAVVVVLIIVLKKKNAPTATDDVAAEGEVAIIDDTAAEEAPAEETPAEETPAEAPAETPAETDDNNQ